MRNEAVLEGGPFQELADAAPVMLWRINSSFDCDWANTAWFDFTGGTLAEETGFAWLDLVHPDDSDRVAEEFGRAFEAREKVSVEFRIRRQDGRYRWILDSGAPYYSEGAFAGFIGSCVDITERRDAEQRTEALASEMVRLSRAEALSSLATGIVHELGQPLQTIGSYADALATLATRTHFQGDELIEGITAIRQAVTRAADIVRNCRSLASGEKSKRVLADVGAVVRAAEPLICAHPLADGVSIDWELASGLDAELTPLEIEQVIINLAANGFEATSGMEGRRLRISAAPWGALAIVAVADNGPGVPPELRHKVFDSLVTSKPKGMGIGLYVSRQIVRAHGGRIWAERGADGGAVFKFTLPLSA
jgi:hypothetical protein